MTKRIICILMLLILVSQGCFAQDVFFGKVEMEEYVPISGALFEDVEVIACEEDEPSISLFNNLSLEEYVLQAVVGNDTLPTEIPNLAQYKIKVEDFPIIYKDIVMRHPELLHTSYKLFYNDTSGFATRIVPQYIIEDMAGAALAISQMESKIKEYTDLAAMYDTNLEKLIVIHDKMVAECDYDASVIGKTDEELAGSPVFHAYGALCNKKAVCQGYSQALYVIGKELGIEMDFCRSDERRHMWNYVKLNDKWYHMDMTNDDPLIKDIDGNLSAREDTRAFHQYFMVSDTGLKVEAHGTDYGTISGERYTCDDTRYQSDYLFNINQVFTAEKDEKGYYTVLLENQVGPLGTAITIPFRSKRLYTGPVVTYPFRTPANVVVVENDEEVTKTLPCLFLAQYATRNLPPVKPFVKAKNWIKAYPPHDAFTKDSYYIIGIAQNVIENPVGEFTSFLFGAETLRPYGSKKNWVLQ